jgi:hypothetical protein
LRELNAIKIYLPDVEAFADKLKLNFNAGWQEQREREIITNLVTINLF